MWTVMRDALLLIQQHKKAYIVLNLAFYGLVLLMMLATLLWPEMQLPFKASVDAPYAPPGLFQWAAHEYAGPNLLAAIGMTFLVNLFVASFAMATLSSLLVPFIGITVLLYSAFLWGVLFAPVGALAVMMLPHSFTVLIEGQAYVLVAFALFVQARMLLWPELYLMASHNAGCQAGARATLKLYALVVPVLLLGAIYELIEGVYFMPLLLRS